MGKARLLIINIIVLHNFISPKIGPKVSTEAE